MADVSSSSVATGIGDVAVAISTALVIVAFAIVPFLNPVWVGFEQGRAEAVAWTGFSEADLRAVTGAILDDLVIGPPDFDVQLDARPVLSDAERSHMRDVRGAFTGFYGAAAVGLAVLGAAFLLAGRGATGWTRRHAWRSVRIGSLGLAAAVVVGGVVAAVAFDAAFGVFHRLFFSAGSYQFDPRTDRLVQLFPEVFWSETAVAVGAVILLLALGTALLARLRLQGPSR